MVEVRDMGEETKTRGRKEMATKHRTIKYREKDHGSFFEELAPHEGVGGWWYITGYLHGLANPEDIYMYMFNTMWDFVEGQPIMVRLSAIGDFRNNTHPYEIDVFPGGSDIAYANGTEVVTPNSILTIGKNKLTAKDQGRDLKYSLELVPKKSPVWHGENGILIMGYPDRPEERTVYWSYTNLTTTGEISYKHSSNVLVTMPVKGKSWFDRQWGPFKNKNWDWFSLRFFDDEEIMLFSFPEQKYKDATYVDRQGKVKTFKDFSYTVDRWLKIEGLNTTAMGIGWEVSIPVKENHYRIVPLADNQIRIHPAGCYYEGLAKIFNDNGKFVGYCVAEILPIQLGEQKWA
jgi:predicted secreted hydrolase